MSLDTRVFLTRYWHGMALATTAFAALSLAGCSTNEMTAAVYVERPIEQIYNAGWFEIERENWMEAAPPFD